MAIYSIGFQTVAAASGTAYAAFRAPTNDSKIREIGFSCDAATVSNISLFRNTNLGYAANTFTSVGQQLNPNDAAGTSRVDTNWISAPTITAANRIRRFTLPAAIGAEVVWYFPKGLWVYLSTATDILVIWNEGGSAGPVLDSYIEWEE